MPASLLNGPKAQHDASRVGAGLSRGPNTRRKYNAAPWSGTWPAPGSTLDLDFANNRGWVRGVGQGGVMDAITFTRASNATYVNSAGLLQTAANNAPRFDWASTTVVANKNIMYATEEVSQQSWWRNPLSSLSISSNATVAPNKSNTADLLIATTYNGAHGLDYLSFHSYSTQSGTPSGKTVTMSWYLKYGGIRYFFLNIGKANQWTELIQVSSPIFDLVDGVIYSAGSGYISSSMTPVGDDWYRCSVTRNVETNGSLAFAISNSTSSLSYIGDNASGVYVWGIQIEYGSSVTDYQPIAQPTTNTPLAPSSSCNGILIEESRTNRILYCRDATQANWVCSNTTPLLNQTGIDGVANAASSLTASADGGTCIQTVTLASGSRTGSVYLKRLTGTGAVQVSLDGSTWSTVDLSPTEWRRIVLSGTVTNPVVGIKLATNGDAVAMDFGQIEDANGASSPILTTAGSATRAFDVDFIMGQPIFGNIKFSVYVEADVIYENGSTTTPAIVGLGTADNNRFFRPIYFDARPSVSFVAPSGSPFIDAPYAIKACQTGFGGSNAFKNTGAINGVSYPSNVYPEVSALTYDRISFGMLYRNTTVQYFINGRVKRAVLFPNLLSTSAMEEITR